MPTDTKPHTNGLPPIDVRRAFYDRIAARDDVINTDFTRDGFRTILVSTANAHLPDDVADDARDMGYAVEPGVYGFDYALAADH